MSLYASGPGTSELLDVMVDATTDPPTQRGTWRERLERIGLTDVERDAVVTLIAGHLEGAARFATAARAPSPRPGAGPSAADAPDIRFGLASNEFSKESKILVQGRALDGQKRIFAPTRHMLLDFASLI